MVWTNVTNSRPPSNPNWKWPKDLPIPVASCRSWQVTVVENVAESSINGSKHTFLHLRLLANDSKLMVPVDNSNRIGLRPLYKRTEIKGLVALLEVRVGSKVSDWKDRYRENLEKMKGVLAPEV